MKSIEHCKKHQRSVKAYVRSEENWNIGLITARRLGIYQSCAGRGSTLLASGEEPHWAAVEAMRWENLLLGGHYATEVACKSAGGALSKRLKFIGLHRCPTGSDG